jgi:hypothetical protein
MFLFFEILQVQKAVLFYGNDLNDLNFAEPGVTRERVAACEEI